MGELTDVDGSSLKERMSVRVFILSGAQISPFRIELRTLRTVQMPINIDELSGIKGNADIQRSWMTSQLARMRSADRL